MYLRHINRGSLFIENRRRVLDGQKAPAGVHLVAPSLESTCFMYLRYKNRGFVCMKNRRCIFAGKKAPAGVHLVAPSLDNTGSVYVQHRNTDSVYVIHRNLHLRHRQCVYLQHRNSVCTTCKLRICNIEYVSLRHTICIFDTCNLYF